MSAVVLCLVLVWKEGRILGVVALECCGVQLKLVGRIVDIKKKKEGEEDAVKRNKIDVVLVTCVYTPKHYMFDRQVFGLMKERSVLINNSRGGIINQNDLVVALTSGTIFAVGLDVMTTESLHTDYSLISRDGCMEGGRVGGRLLLCAERMTDSVNDCNDGQRACFKLGFFLDVRVPLSVSQRTLDWFLNQRHGGQIDLAEDFEDARTAAGGAMERLFGVGRDGVFFGQGFNNGSCFLRDGSVFDVDNGRTCSCCMESRSFSSSVGSFFCWKMGLVRASECWMSRGLWNQH